ncbi:MAG: type II secretion system protein GspJ [Sutterellaceae bacterium]|nr:prepilin-type N-terminal cleavage/methylation domain-containing protein [Burkholderiaceae bacterium]MCX7901371.1 prepilin-type N-terminal cleavage/methylation domain-containing protein [Burkholderiaceae bacterium]MDW8429948.1 type II secretion system protein GspJ [Sutterellaceae bacterium]
MKARTCRGFTLLELLVAISVLAMVSLIAWRGLESLTATRARLAPEAEDVRALLTAFGQLERDLARAVNPQLFATDGPSVAVAAIGGAPALTIVRSAPDTPDGATAIQVIGYRVEEGVLVRSASAALRARGTLGPEDLTRVRLLANVQSLRVRLWRDGMGWHDPLDPNAAPAPPTAGSWPAPPGVEVTIVRSDGKAFRRVLLVG